MQAETEQGPDELQDEAAELRIAAGWPSPGEASRPRGEAHGPGSPAGSAIAVLQYDLEGRLVDANASSLSYLGLPSLQTMSGWNLFDSAALTAEQKAQLRCGEPVRARAAVDFDEMRRQGLYEPRRSGVAHLEWVIAPTNQSSYLAMIQDVTEQVEAARALQARAERYRRLAEHAPDIIYRISFAPELRIEYISPAIQEIAGYTPEELYAAPETVRRLIHPDDVSTIVALDPGADPVGSVVRIRWQRKDGEYIWLEHRFALLKDEAGRPIAVEGIARDVTERVRVREALEQSVREKDLLLKEIHHRVKNNLALVSSLLGLQSATTGDETVRAALLTSQKRIMAVARVHEVLYRSEGVGRINLGQYVRMLTTELCSALCTNDVSIEYELARASVPAEQAVYYGLILNELLSNAFKHAFPAAENGRAGTVRVVVKTSRGKTIIAVSDDGVGLPPDFEERVKHSLGYQVVTLLTEQMGGVIRYESRPGEGARFELTIAARKRAAQA
ncbi:MAG: putative sensor histidine kinase pdtaS [Chloroflexi bacterium ADurb.Bin325]|nr:MAG: putative sensor histidine kinase pdtaS [Chloroflexi bacterium ADurb.Bin325]